MVWCKGQHRPCVYVMRAAPFEGELLLKCHAFNFAKVNCESGELDNGSSGLCTGEHERPGLDWPSGRAASGPVDASTRCSKNSIRLRWHYKLFGGCLVEAAICRDRPPDYRKR